MITRVLTGKSLAIIPVLFVLTSAHAKGLSWSAVSDLSTVGLVAITSAKTGWGKTDPEGFKQYALTLTSTTALTQGLKVATHVNRPDGSDQRSFPSEHSAVAFSSVGFLTHRYGHQVSRYQARLLAAGALAAIGRVQANKHRWVDVIVGGGIGWANAYFWTKPIQRNTVLSLAPLDRGVTLTYQKVW
jgi:membrane-associated phospholipid phosphatase